MQLSNFRKGLEILSHYYDDPGGYHIGAEHDAFYAYATDKPLTDADVRCMIELGWFQEDTERDDDGEFTAEQYNPDEGWTAYT